MKDPFGRTIDYLRVSVTDRCNLRCRYCRRGGEVEMLDRGMILSLERIAEVVRVAAVMGIKKVRITGGEPLMRRGIVSLVEMLRDIDALDELAMTTNGTMLADYAEPLALAGLDRVNVSLDAISPARYAEITGGGKISDVFAGIQAARQAGLEPVKLNCVVSASANEPDAVDVAQFAREQGLEVRFIYQMDLAGGKFSVVDGGTGGDCPRCNRLRLTSDGTIRPCLFSDLGFNICSLGIDEALRRAVAQKPRAGASAAGATMYAIGG